MTSYIMLFTHQIRTQQILDYNKEEPNGDLWSWHPLQRGGKSRKSNLNDKTIQNIIFYLEIVSLTIWGCAVCMRAGL